MIARVAVSGSDRLARRIAGLAAGVRQSGAAGAGAAAAAQALRGAAESAGAQVRIDAAGPNTRRVVVTGDNLWEREFGSRRVRGDGAIARAVQSAGRVARAAMARTLRDIMGTGHGA